jgi:hypothetical protein
LKSVPLLPLITLAAVVVPAACALFAVALTALTEFVIVVSVVRVVIFPIEFVPVLRPTVPIDALPATRDGKDAIDTGCVVCQKVPVTGVDGIVAMLTGCVAG